MIDASKSANVPRAGEEEALGSTMGTMGSI